MQLLHKVEAAAFDKLVHAVVESFQSGDFPSDEAFERVQADVGGDEVSARPTGSHEGSLGVAVDMGREDI